MTAPSNREVRDWFTVCSHLWEYRPDLAKLEDGPRDDEAQAWFRLQELLQRHGQEQANATD